LCARSPVAPNSTKASDLGSVIIGLHPLPCADSRRFG